MDRMEKLYQHIKSLINNINNPPADVRKRQVWKIPLLEPFIYLLVMWTDDEYARVIPMMRCVEVPKEMFRKENIMFSEPLISMSQLGVIAFIRRAQMIEVEKIKNLTYIGELSMDNFKVIHYADHNDYSLIDNNRFCRADVGYVIKNRRN